MLRFFKNPIVSRSSDGIGKAKENIEERDTIQSQRSSPYGYIAAACINVTTNQIADWHRNSNDSTKERKTPSPRIYSCYVNDISIHKIGHFKMHLKEKTDSNNVSLYLCIAIKKIPLPPVRPTGTVDIKRYSAGNDS